MRLLVGVLLETDRILDGNSEVKDDTSYFSYYEKTLPGSYVDELFSQERDDGELYQYKKYSGHFKCPVYDLSGNDPNKLTLTLETLFHTDQLNKCFVPKIGLVE